MTCPFHGQLTSSDPLGSSSCVAYSASYAICAATNGAVHPTGAQVRAATGDKSGGLELSQVAAVMKRDYELLVTAGVFTRAVYEDRIASKSWGGVLIGGYSPIEHSSFDGCPGFLGNHAIWETAAADEDPLADGRRAGIYDYQGRPYPLELRRAFAGALRLGNGSLAGPDHFEAILVPLPAPVLVTPHVRVATGSFRTYTVRNTGKLHTYNSSQRKAPLDTEYPCSPAEWTVLVGLANSPVLMRQLTGGPYAGTWVVAHGALPFSTGPITQPAQARARVLAGLLPDVPPVPYDPDAAPLSGATADPVPEDPS